MKWIRYSAIARLCTLRGGKLPPQAAGCRSGVGHPDSKGRQLKEVVTPAAKREVAE